jgi:hypothetical protein
LCGFQGKSRILQNWLLSAQGSLFLEFIRRTFKIDAIIRNPRYIRPFASELKNDIITIKNTNKNELMELIN